MAISGTRFDLELNIDPSYKSDQVLLRHLKETTHYLNCLEHSGLRWLGLTRKNYHRYSRSWMRINLDLEAFLANPRIEYTHFMRILDTEYARFPSHSVYARHLKSLSDFLSQGPIFSDEIKRSVLKD